MTPLILLLALLLPPPASPNAQVFPSTATATIYGCNQLNDCSGHGACKSLKNECECTRGYGDAQEAEWMGYRPSYDCSVLTCPFGYSWGGLPMPNGTHAAGDGVDGNTGRAHPKAECSDRGHCDRETGACVCLPNFRGGACDYSVCPGKGDCSGHGKCLPMQVMAQMDNALPLSKNQNTTSAYFQPDPEFTKTWDQ